jgi:hypothetical protein
LLFFMYCFGWLSGQCRGRFQAFTLYSAWLADLCKSWVAESLG